MTNTAKGLIKKLESKLGLGKNEVTFSSKEAMWLIEQAKSRQFLVKENNRRYTIIKELIEYLENFNITQEEKEYLNSLLEEEE